MADTKRVCILGSGPSALSAAFRLSAPELRGAFDITVYQVGWRSGGLCAGGRVAPEYWVNQNGTHYLFGCYAEALYVLRTCCEELIAHGDLRFGPFEQQVISRPLIVMMDRFKGEWEKWCWTFPPRAGTPGVHRPDFGPVDIFTVAMSRLVRWTQSARFAEDILGPDPPLLERAAFEAEMAVTSAAGEGLLELIERVELEGGVGAILCGLLVAALEVLRGLFGVMLRGRAEDNLNARHAWMLIDFALSAAIGALRAEAVGPELVERLDDVDLKQWLRDAGADESTVDSPLINLWYDAMGAFVGGDPSQPLCATGASLSCLGQILLNYVGEVSYQLRYEVGDTLVGPVFAALKRRGVKFAYFHRAWELVPEYVPAAGAYRVARVVLERQAELTCGDPLGYDPFIYPLRARTPPDERPMWPDVPNADQLAKVYAPPGSELDRFYCPRSGPDVVLEHGRDYDLLVCGMSGPTLRWYAKPLGAVNDRWRDLLAHTRAVETQGLRLWFYGDLKAVGWTEGAPVLSGYAIPFATWEDPSEVIATELWPAPVPKTCAHLFGPLSFNPDWPDPTEVDAGSLYLQAQQARAQAAANGWLLEHTRGLWPGVCLLGGGAINPQDCARPAAIAPEDGPGQARANAGPDQAYFWLYPGTWKYRLSPAERCFEDFYAVGDWTKTSFPCGSLEGAMLSGAMAASDIVRRYGPPKA
ncbi:MAG: NAD(P)-binding protein [Polyangiales bacterium]